MKKEFNYITYTQIAYSMYDYNKNAKTKTFTIIDAQILNLAISFYKSGTKFYMSNLELSKILLSHPSTIQRSIDRLVSCKLLYKKTNYSNNKRCRYLEYVPENAEKLLRIKV